MSFGLAEAFLDRRLFQQLAIAGCLVGLAAGASRAGCVATELIGPAPFEVSFGLTVLYAGDRAYVGAGGFFTPGAVHVFERDEASASGWRFEHRLDAGLPATERDRFGESLAVDRDRLLVGAPYHGDLEGKAYIYDLGSWTLVKELEASDPVYNARFGAPVALSGDVALIGAPRFNAGVYFFERSAGGPDQWGEVARFHRTPTPSAPFGFSVALEGRWAAAGEPDTATVFLFWRSDEGQWTEIGQLTGQPGSWFGGVVQMDAGRLAVAARHEQDTGAIHVFERLGSGPNPWTEVDTIRPADLTQFSYFGDLTVLHGDRLAVPLRRTQILVFERASDGTWSELSRFVPPGNQIAAGFWFSGATFVTDVPGDRAFVSEPCVDALPVAGEVAGLRLSKPGGLLRLAWLPSCRSSDTDFAIYTGTLGQFETHRRLACTTDGFTDATTDLDGPSSYYLVVPNNGLAEGSYGRGFLGQQRPASSESCLPQAVDLCP